MRQSAWIAGGAAVALLGVGIGMSAVSYRKASNADALARGRDPLGQPIPFADVAGKYNAYRDDATKYGGVGIVMYSLAAVAAGVSGYLFYVTRPIGKDAGQEKPQARLTLRPELSPTTAGFVAGMEF
jgi:hypothetical protein